MRSIGILTVALAATLILGCDRNNRNDTTRAGSGVGTTGLSDQVSRGDKAFVRDMAIANMAEVELGKLVPERSTDTEVKKFAQMMITDHGQSLSSLKAIAMQHQVPVPADLDGKHTGLRDKLAKWHGNEFDREYMDAMVDEHDDVLDALESRVDEKTLAEYKAEMDDRVAGRKTVEVGATIAIVPEKSDNPVTMRLNEWAAATYPVVRGHLDAARVLKVAVDKRRTAD